MLLYQILAYAMTGKIYKSHKKNINLKYHLQPGMINFNYLKDCIMYQIFKIILSISSRNMGK